MNFQPYCLGFDCTCNGHCIGGRADRKVLDADQQDSAQVAALASSQVHPDMALPHTRTAAAICEGVVAKSRNSLFRSGAKICAGEILAAQQADDLDFKNFHRLLCERFGYAHDEQDWKRDQLSLIEHIARATSWTPASNPPDADTTVMLALADGEVWQGYFDGEAWIEVSGLRLQAGRVAYWQHTPAHPEDKS